MILSIESSCDDSSISITQIETNKLIYHKKISQELQHSIYGGVVPELAARLHIEALPKILEECKEYFPFLKAIAVTNAPGLSVTLTEGVTMAKALVISLNLPLIAVELLLGLRAKPPEIFASSIWGSNCYRRKICTPARCSLCISFW